MKNTGLQYICTSKMLAEKALTSPINVCQVEVHSKDWQRLLGERARVHGAQAKREDAGK